MAVAVERFEPVTFAPADTPSGLSLEQVRALDADDLRLLDAWHREHAGDNDGRPWIPGAIRALTLETRLRLAGDVRLAAAWRRRELLRVGESAVYFVANYGSIQPEEGPPIPFDLWPEQREVLVLFIRRDRVVVLKARQLGLTWLAIHYALHLMAFEERTPNARVLALSKVGTDAKKLLDRARKVARRLPAFLRPTEDRTTRESSTNFKLAGRGEMVSLMSTPESARMETATLAILDEFAHVRNRSAQATLTAVLPTLGTTGKAIVIFTGNGPPEAPGNGQAAAKLYQRAAEGSEAEGGRWSPVFLPDTVDPRRDEPTRKAQREEFLSEEDYRAEHPMTADEALAGRTEGKVFAPSEITAAIAIGRELDELLLDGAIAPPVDERIRIGGDFGDLLGLLPIWPLEGGGIYVPPGEVIPEAGKLSIAAACAAIHDNIAQWQRDGEPLIESLDYDASAPQSAATFRATVEGRLDPRREDYQDLSVAFVDQWSWVLRRYRGRALRRVPMRGVPFGKYKHSSLDYLRHLFARAGRNEAIRVIAISPTNKSLIRQLRGLETKDDRTGRIRKGDDEGPDALIAGVTTTALRHRGEQLAEDLGEGDPEPEPERKPAYPYRD